jgi:hypothetical protein
MCLREAIFGLRRAVELAVKVRMVSVICNHICLLCSLDAVLRGIYKSTL